MGRAIVREPHAFLMDEPLSNLDAKLRVQMRAEIHQLQRRLGVTTIYVTHDQVEAMTMGDRVAVMRGGRLQQVDTPQVLYDQPVNEFVAGFIGSPSINLVEAGLERQNGGLAVTFGNHRLSVDDRAARNRSGLANYVGRTLILGIRPEDLEDASLQPDAPADRRIKTVAVLTEPLGAEVLVHFATSAVGVVSSAIEEQAADAEVHFGGGADEDEGEDPSGRPRQPEDANRRAAADRARRRHESPVLLRPRDPRRASSRGRRPPPAATRQPLTAPAVKPARMRRCSASVITISGKVTTTVAAMISPHGIWNALPVLPVNVVIATVTVCLSGVSVKESAKRNSCQAAMKASSPAVTRPGATSGSITL